MVAVLTKATGFFSSEGNGAPALFKAPPAEAEGIELAAPTADAVPEVAANEEPALSKAPPSLDAAAEESWRFADFVLNDADPSYRGPLQDFYHAWQDFNERFFEERLKVPHLTIANGPPRALGFFKSLTDYGGRTQITLDVRVLAARRRFVHQPYPAEGTRLFLHDLLLHEMQHQYLAEVEHYPDKENAKHGEAFADLCNRIGRTMGLPRVYTRRRTKEDAGKPLANFWPLNVRPAGYYLGHVTPPGRARAPRGPGLRGIAGVVSLLRYFLDAGQPEKVAAIVQREAEIVLEQACTAKPSAEKGQVARFNPSWLSWNNGCVKQLLHAICKRRMMDLMPLLADALEAAGCGDELLLAHCRLPVRHTRDCWVLDALING
jgi:hypothetical protein